MKNKSVYFLCCIEDFDRDFFDEEYDLEDLTVASLVGKGFRFIVSTEDNGEASSYTDNVNNPDRKANKKLLDLIHDYMFDFDEMSLKEVSEKMHELSDDINSRLELLIDKHFIFKMDLKTKKLNRVSNSTISNCLNNYQKSANISNSHSDDFEVSRVSHDYLKIFKEQLDKCFGENKSAIATFYSKHRGEQSWDIIKKNGEYRFGVNEDQHIFFGARIINLFLEDSSCILRIFTSQVVNKIPVKEMYAFVIHNDSSIQNMSYLDVREAFTKDFKTGREIKPEKNLVFCDLNNNKFCSDDIEIENSFKRVKYKK